MFFAIHLNFSRRLLPFAAAFLVIVFLFQSPLLAQLRWETTTIEKTLDLGQPRAEATFVFENTGEYPVTILSTSSSCGCTTAALGQKTYGPGEKGEITARFEVGGRTGSQRNTIRVDTDDTAASLIDLLFALEIPTLVELNPRFLTWWIGEDPKAKTVRVSLNPEANLKLTGVKVDNDQFEAILVAKEKPYEFEVHLTPRDTNSANRAVFSLQTDPKAQNQANFTFYAFIR